MNSFISDVNVNSQDVEEGQLPEAECQQPVLTLFDQLSPRCYNQHHIPSSTHIQNQASHIQKIPLNSKHQVEQDSDSSGEIVFQTVTDKDYNKDHQHGSEKKKKKIQKSTEYRNKPKHANNERDKTSQDRNRQYEKKDTYFREKDQPINNQYPQVMPPMYSTPPVPFYPSPYMYPPMMPPQMYGGGYPMPFMPPNPQFMFNPNMPMPMQQMMHPQMQMPPMPHMHAIPNQTQNYQQMQTMQPPQYKSSKQHYYNNQNNQPFRNKPHQPPNHNSYQKSNQTNYNQPQYQNKNKISETPEPPKIDKRKQNLDEVKTNIKEVLKVFDQNEQEEILENLRNIAKHSQKMNEMINSNKDSTMFAVFETQQFNIINSNYDRSLMKLEKIIDNFEKKAKSEDSNSVGKKDALMQLMNALQMKDTMNKIKERRLSKKLISEKEQSEMKKLLDILVRDPRKIVK